MKHEGILSHQKHYSHPIFDDYGTFQFSSRIIDKENDIIVTPLDSFSFKSTILFQNKYKTPAEKHNKSLHQQPLLLNDTDVTKDDDDHTNTGIPKSVTLASKDRLNDTSPTPTYHIHKAILQLPNKKLLKCELLLLIKQNLINSLQIFLKSYPSMTLPSLNTKNYFQVAAIHKRPSPTG